MATEETETEQTTETSSEENTESSSEESTESTNTDSSSSSTGTSSSEDIDVSQYGIFGDAVGTVSQTSGEVQTVSDELSKASEKLSSPEIFMGPIADECTNTMSQAATKLSTIMENLSTISNHLIENSKDYQSSDSTASTKVLTTDANGKLTESTSPFTSDMLTNTQVNELAALGKKADEGDSAAQQEMIDKLAKIVSPICEKYNFPPSVVIAQIIQESGWVKGEKDLTTQANNVLSVNTEMWHGNNSEQDYTTTINGETISNPTYSNWWNKSHESSTYNVSHGAHLESRGDDSMRVYDSIEDCVDDYLALRTAHWPELRGMDAYSAINSDSTKAYAEDVSYGEKLTTLVNDHNLTQYDKVTT